MKVNPTATQASQANQANAAYQPKKTSASAPSDETDSAQKGKPSPEVSARAQISAKAKEMAKAKQIASETGDVREAKIAELKKRIENKEYNVKPADIADRIIDDHLNLGGA